MPSELLYGSRSPAEPKVFATPWNRSKKAKHVLPKGPFDVLVFKHQNHTVHPKPSLITVKIHMYQRKVHRHRRWSEVLATPRSTGDLVRGNVLPSIVVDT